MLGMRRKARCHSMLSSSSLRTSNLFDTLSINGRSSSNERAGGQTDEVFMVVDGIVLSIYETSSIYSPLHCIHVFATLQYTYSIRNAQISYPSSTFLPFSYHSLAMSYEAQRIAARPGPKRQN